MCVALFATDSTVAKMRMYYRKVDRLLLRRHSKTCALLLPNDTPTSSPVPLERLLLLRGARISPTG